MSHNSIISGMGEPVPAIRVIDRNCDVFPLIYFDQLNCSRLMLRSVTCQLNVQKNRNQILLIILFNPNFSIVVSMLYQF